MNIVIHNAEFTRGIMNMVMIRKDERRSWMCASEKQAHRHFGRGTKNSAALVGQRWVVVEYAMSIIGGDEHP